MGRWLERWGGPLVDILFPITTGRIVSGLSAGLVSRAETYTDDVKVQPKLPPAHLRQQRMVTVRDDGGPTVGVVQRHGYGFNVWAETSVNAERLARMCMALLPALVDGSPVVRVTGLSGPFEILDEGTDLLSVGGRTLSHYYFSAQVWSRGADLN